MLDDTLFETTGSRQTSQMEDHRSSLSAVSLEQIFRSSPMTYSKFADTIHTAHLCSFYLCFLSHYQTTDMNCKFLIYIRLHFSSYIVHQQRRLPKLHLPICTEEPIRTDPFHNQSFSVFHTDESVKTNEQFVPGLGCSECRKQAYMYLCVKRKAIPPSSVLQ